MSPENVIVTGDCVEVMAAFDAESVDAIVTDPPYGLEFMGKSWDKLGATIEPTTDTTWLDRAPGSTLPFGGAGQRVRYGKSAASMQSWHEAWARAAFRVARPSSYLLAFGGTRTVHRMTSAIEDAGWIIRDCLVWAYASGFPKSRASLKPAWEPIVMARKPGPLRMLAIDDCRITYVSDDDYAATVAEQSGPSSWKRVKTPTTSIDLEPTGGVSANALGRWPANVLLTDPIFDGGWEGVVGGGEAGGNAPASGPTWSGASGSASRNDFAGMGEREPQFYGDSGTYSRFFLIPKADRTDREPVMRTTDPRESVVPGADGSAPAALHQSAFDATRPTRDRLNLHPTVKPVELMRHLVRLVTPPDGLVLDPFLGSGTTALACELEGFRWLGIEKEPEYVAIAEARLNGTQRGFGLAG